MGSDVVFLYAIKGTTHWTLSYSHRDARVLMSRVVAGGTEELALLLMQQIQDATAAAPFAGVTITIRDVPSIAAAVSAVTATPPSPSAAASTATTPPQKH